MTTDARTEAATATDTATFVEADTSYGRLRGRDVKGIKVFKGIPYGASTAGGSGSCPPWWRRSGWPCIP